MNKTLLSLYGLKWNPFGSELPPEALYLPPRLTEFFWRIENVLVREGGFALIHGDPGTGKSVVLRALAGRLERSADLVVGVLTHPQSRLADFYRELGELFGLALRPSNRWAGFKALRERWIAHLEATRMRAVLLVDEAQEMTPDTLSELRLLGQARFDSRPLLAIVLSGDARLTEALKQEQLLPLGSRIRCRLALDYASREELAACLDHLLDSAGNPTLMNPALKQTLCEHSGGNFRVLTNLAAQLLATGAQRELPQLDEKLYFEVFAPPTAAPAAHRAARMR